jgi:hypothetical protein
VAAALSRLGLPGAPSELKGRGKWKDETECIVPEENRDA